MEILGIIIVFYVLFAFTELAAMSLTHGKAGRTKTK